MTASSAKTPAKIGHNHPRGLRRWRHPGMQQTFQEVGDGTVRVTADDGRSGLFHADGRYISGDLTQVSKHMLVWTADSWLPDVCNYRWTMVPVDIDRPSGWPEEQEKALHFHLSDSPKSRG
jgi:hypothetical protein